MSQFLPLPQVKPGVFFAPVAGEGVLLDITANRYVGLTALSARLWSAIGRGDSYENLVQAVAQSEATSKVGPEKIVQQQLKLWNEAGLLVQDHAATAFDLPVPRMGIPRATDSIPPAEAAKARFSVGYVVRQVWNSLWVRRSLRHAGLSATICAIQRIPIAHSENPATSRLKVMLRSYWWARKPVSQGNPDCLSRSLSLLRTLRQARVDASICIGVRKCPFAAHAWVEAANLVLNDKPENVDQYFVIARF